ncbi:MAG TPA: asparagine synthase-related protein, partial [Allocoleopsis sp.]
PKIPLLYDEPFADSSQIPTFLVSELARQQVTVSLSGDGGDELFGGYHRYPLGRSIWRTTGWIPKPVRQMIARGITKLPAQTWNQMLVNLNPLLPQVLKKGTVGERLHKLAEVFAADSPDALYLGFASHWKQPESIVMNGVEPLTTLTDRQRWAQIQDFTQRMMYFDLMTYLPDDILVKVDRATMGVSLESRIPLLDPRVIEFAWRLPLSMKLRNGQGKWLLRQVLYKYVPPALIERPKMGFGIPLHSWLRGSLRDWAEALLDEDRLRQEGFFHPQPIRQKWTAHLAGDRNWEHWLWDVLMFQAWLDPDFSPRF